VGGRRRLADRQPTSGGRLKSGWVSSVVGEEPRVIGEEGGLAACGPSRPGGVFCGQSLAGYSRNQKRIRVGTHMEEAVSPPPQAVAEATATPPSSARGASGSFTPHGTDCEIPWHRRFFGSPTSPQDEIRDSGRSEPADEPVPLRLVVARCLEEWGVHSSDSEDTDDFCGWHVGSRVTGDRSTDTFESVIEKRRRSAAAAAPGSERQRNAASRIVLGLDGRRLSPDDRGANGKPYCVVQ
jgi:hypothetical protein